MNGDVFEVLKSKRVIEIFLAISKSNSPLYISRKLRASYSYVMTVINTFKKYGLIDKSKNGRDIEIYYTSIGEQVAILLQQANKIYMQI